jgi:hypothetical protein
MTREELLAEALRCAKAATRAADLGATAAASSEAWSRAGMLFVEIAALTDPPGRPPPDWYVDQYNKP